MLCNKTKFQMSANTNNCKLQSVERQRLLPSC